MLKDAQQRFKQGVTEFADDANQKQEAVVNAEGFEELIEALEDQAQFFLDSSINKKHSAIMKGNEMAYFIALGHEQCWGSVLETILNCKQKTYEGEETDGAGT